MLRPTKAQPNTSLDASGGGVFLNLLGAANGALIRAAASTSMKPGRVKRKIGKIGSPFYSRSPELDHNEWSGNFEASLNGATKLILKPRGLIQRDHLSIC